MLQNAYFLAKIGVDTAENERNFAENLPKIGNYPTALADARGRSRRSGSSGGPGAESGAGLGPLYAGISPHKARARFFARPVWAEMTRSPPRCKHVCLNWDFVLRCICSNFGGIPSFSVFSTAWSQATRFHHRCDKKY